MLVQYCRAYGLWGKEEMEELNYFQITESKPMLPNVGWEGEQHKNGLTGWFVSVVIQ